MSEFKGKLKYIKENLGLDDETIINKLEKAVNSIIKIGEIGDRLNTHKYDVWIANQIKKDLNLTNQLGQIQLVIDWAKNTRADIFKFSMKEAMEAQEQWHTLNFKKIEIKTLEIPNLDHNRVVFRCSDQQHFLYLLSDKDLDYEGKTMKHCVGSYKNQVKNQNIFIVSLRDLKNEPHVTIEINTNSRETVQIRGKANGNPVEKYQKLIREFALYASGWEKIKEDKELLDLLNLDLLKD